MKYNHTLIVFKKELKDIFRDKRTWIASVLIPVLIFPLMFFLMGFGKAKLDKTLENDLPIYIESKQQNELAEYLNEVPGLIAVESDNPYEALQKGEIKVIVEIEENFQQKLHKEEPGGVKLIYDEISNESSMAMSVVDRAIMAFSDEVRNNRLKELGINPGILQPTSITREAYVPEGQESKGDGVSVMLLTFLLPFLLMLYPVVGGMPAAIDLGAGEKERMSLEPLLSTGANRMSILLGKYLTILLASIVGVITSLSGILIATRFNTDILPQGVKISPLSMLIMIGISLTMALMLSGLMLSISIFAKSSKEAGTYLSPITFLLMIPTYLTMFMDVRTIPNKLFFVPLLNAVLLMKEVLVDIINPTHIIITFSFSAVLVILSLLFTKYIFSKESAIFRS